MDSRVDVISRAAKTKGFDHIQRERTARTLSMSQKLEHVADDQSVRGLANKLCHQRHKSKIDVK